MWSWDKATDYETAVHEIHVLPWIQLVRSIFAILPGPLTRFPRVNSEGLGTRLAHIIAVVISGVAYNRGAQGWTFFATYVSTYSPLTARLAAVRFRTSRTWVRTGPGPEGQVQVCKIIDFAGPRPRPAGPGGYWWVVWPFNGLESMKNDVIYLKEEQNWLYPDLLDLGGPQVHRQVQVRQMGGPTLRSGSGSGKSRSDYFFGHFSKGAPDRHCRTAGWLVGSLPGGQIVLSTLQ